jgi:hypothetical protein
VCVHTHTDTHTHTHTHTHTQTHTQTYTHREHTSTWDPSTLKKRKRVPDKNLQKKLKTGSVFLTKQSQK